MGIGLSTLFALHMVAGISVGHPPKPIASAPISGAAPGNHTPSPHYATSVGHPSLSERLRLGGGSPPPIRSR